MKTMRSSVPVSVSSCGAGADIAVVILARAGRIPSERIAATSVSEWTGRKRRSIHSLTLVATKIMAFAVLQTKLAKLTGEQLAPMLELKRELMYTVGTLKQGHDYSGILAENLSE